MEKLKRLNIYINDELKDYVVKESRRMSMSQSAFIVMCINYYKEDKDSIITIEKMVNKFGGKL